MELELSLIIPVNSKEEESFCEPQAAIGWGLIKECPGSYSVVSERCRRPIMAGVNDTVRIVVEQVYYRPIGYKEKAVRAGIVLRRECPDI